MNLRQFFDKNNWFWASTFLGAFAIHFGTAILRLGSFFPSPQALDFASYYAGAWALRWRVSPYEWSSELLDFLSTSQQLSFTPPAHNSTPLWAWVMQPFTYFSYPVGASLWILFLLGLTILSHIWLARLAGFEDKKVVWLTLPLTLTFGPLFLNLTLGQNGIILLFALLLMARNRGRSPSVIGWVLASDAKIYPAVWAGALVLQKKWWALGLHLAGLAVGLTLVSALTPEASRVYWTEFLPGQASRFSTGANIDDQSLSAWLQRVGQSHSYSFPGLLTSQRVTADWQLPWEIPTLVLQGLTYLALFLLGGWLILRWYKVKPKKVDGILFGIALFSLLILPHMARYNHVIALPALAWLWVRGQRGQQYALAGYALFGLSRLNHLWAQVLPAPLGPLSTGFGLFGVVLLIVGIGKLLSSPVGQSDIISK
jgi:hypothetical protein